MAWHSMKEAVRLTGRSRRSIYRDITTGRVSSELGRDGQRRFETSELIRAYGPLLPVAHPDTPKVAQAVTPSEAHPEGMAEVLAELRELRQEVRELKETLRLLEHKPAPAPAITTHQKKSAEPATWANLLDALG